MDIAKLDNLSVHNVVFEKDEHNKDARRFSIFIAVNNADEPFKINDLNLQLYLKFKSNDKFLYEYAKTHLVSAETKVIRLWRSLDGVDYTTVNIPDNILGPAASRSTDSLNKDLATIIDLIDDEDSDEDQSLKKFLFPIEDDDEDCSEQWLDEDLLSSMDSISCDGKGLIRKVKRRADDIWDDDMEVELIETYYKEKKNKKIKNIWDNVAANMNSKGYSVPKSAAKSKFNRLLGDFKLAFDQNKESGRGSKAAPHYDLFEEILAKKPNVSAVSSCSSLKIPNSSVKKEEDNHKINAKKRNKLDAEEEEDCKKPKIKKVRQTPEEKLMQFMGEKNDSIMKAMSDNTNNLISSFGAILKDLNK